MNYPDFYDQAPRITVHDPLSEFLGAFEDGIITYRYIDAVRLAGHSCPTVAGAWLLTRRALQLLYPQGVAERGTVQVRFSGAVDEGVVGVIASIASLATGTAGPGGFKGIGMRFRRQNTLYFAQALEGEVRFERLDNGASVQLRTDMQQVPGDPRTMTLLRQILGGQARPGDQALFSRLWQERVRRILLDHADDPHLIVELEPLAA